jgi:diacylglycerol kinase (ATP)
VKYSSINIICNPNSTGDSEAMARELKRLLGKKLDGIPIELTPTKHAGHAEEIAYGIASKQKSPLIVSSSGDGGYHEVVNGVMRADNASAVCAVLPVGNANDHSRTIQDAPLWEAIVAGKVSTLDLLKVTTGSGAKKITRYAHSYVGLGLTPVVATELNKHTLNAFREAMIVVKTFIKYRPFKIQHKGSILKLDSLLFANINQMAKILTVAPTNKPNDGKFEIVSFPAGNKLQLIKRLATAAVSNLDRVYTADNYTFTVIKKMPIQMDGEVTTLPAGCNVDIGSAHRALNTVI